MNPRRNILVLTSMYPDLSLETNTTPVVHYFCKEWVKEGHKVIVIHNYNKFPIFYYFFPRYFRDLIESIFAVRVPNFDQRKEFKFELDNVLVYRFPILKIFPFFRISNNLLNKQFRKILFVCENNNFSPDFILGHWEYPQLPLISKLKNVYILSVTSLVFHGVFYIKKYLDLRKDVSSLNFIGFRSRGIRNEFESLLGHYSNSFLCYSGLPQSFSDKVSVPQRSWFEIKSFTFVGLLIRRKFPHIILPALVKSNFSSSFEFNLVGKGSLESRIRQDSYVYDLKERVRFLSNLSRIDVFELFKKTDIFIMISRDEAFGLVYIEAMLAGCIVIASKNEGMDGIIIHGYNGFLIDSGSELQLVSILNFISLNKYKLSEISFNAYSTAKLLTDKKVALEYLNSLNSFR